MTSFQVFICGVERVPHFLPEDPALCCSPFRSEECAERNGRRTSLTSTGLGGEAR